MKAQKLVEDILEAHGLKKTLIRIEMLSIFLSHDFALSANDVMEEMKSAHDRVTIYRALTSFEDNGILHKASAEGQAVKYALCNMSCPDHSHADTHAHFICNTCHHTFCLEDVKVPTVNLPHNFSVKSADYTLSGVCNRCLTD